MNALYNAQNLPTSVTAPSDLFTLSQLEILIARHVLHYASKSWGYCLKKFQTMADEFNCSYKTIARCVKKLVSMGYVKMYRGGCNPCKLVALDKLRAAFSQCPLNVQSIAPILYIKKEKDDESKDTEIIEHTGDEIGATVREKETAKQDISKARAKGTKISSVKGLTKHIIDQIRKGKRRVFEGRKQKPAPNLDKAFIERNARPGESWEQAAARLGKKL